MKKLLGIVVLSLFLITPSEADDIQDFQIEGMSIGDSALDYFSEDQIKNNKRNWFKNNKFSHTELRNLGSFKQYEDIHINYLSKDNKFLLHAIEGVSFFRNKIEACYKEMDEIDLEFSNLFQNTRKLPKKKHKHGDTSATGDNYITDIIYQFNNGDRILLACYDWSTESGNGDHLRISLRTKEFDNFLTYKAYTETKETKKEPKKKEKTDSNNSLSQQIKDLNEMYKSGALTKEEFEKAKKKLLN